jgi:hypothetical protein
MSTSETATVRIAHVEDSEGWQAVYLEGALVMETDLLDWLDLIHALEAHPHVSMTRLAFKSRDVEEYPKRLSEVLQWELDEE